LALILAVVGCGEARLALAEPEPDCQPEPNGGADAFAYSFAMPTPTFVATGSMHVARMDATATLLQDGKVLIAGGADMQVFRMTSRLVRRTVRPSTGKFTADRLDDSSSIHFTLLRPWTLS